MKLARRKRKGGNLAFCLGLRVGAQPVVAGVCFNELPDFKIAVIFLPYERILGEGLHCRREVFCLDNLHGRIIIGERPTEFEDARIVKPLQISYVRLQQTLREFVPVFS